MMESSFTSSTTKGLYRGTQITSYALALLELLLAFRFILKLLNANPYAGFTQFIYGITYPFVVPFSNVFQTPEIMGSVFEWTTALAMFVYWIIAIGIIKLFLMSKTVSTPEAAVKLKEKEN